MSVTTTAVSVETPGNGIATAFSFAFKILAQTDLVVKVKTIATGLYGAALTLGVDYSVVFDSTAQTGTVTMLLIVPTTGQAINIKRVSDNTQQTVYPREGNLPAKTAETAVDKLTLLVQELQARVTALGG